MMKSRNRKEQTKTMNKPKDKEKVFALLADGSIAVHYWSDNKTENNMLLQGNIFKTEDEAKKERANRLSKALGAIARPSVQIRREKKRDVLVIADRYAIDFKSLLEVCEEYQKTCQRA